MNKKNFIPMLALMGLTAMAPATPLVAQEQQPGVSPEAEALSLTGEVIAMDQQALRVRTATGVENVILTNRTDKAAGVEIGDQVRVDFTRSSQGVMIATTVRELSGAEAGATGQPMSGSEVMGQAAQGGSATAPQGQSLNQPGSETGQSGTTGATTDTMGSSGTTGSTGSTAGTAGSTYGSTTGSPSATSGSTGSTTDTMGSTDSTGSASSYDDQSAATETETGTETGMESDTATAGSLPDTGSSLPLAGLAGLLALGLAVALRSLR